MTYQSSVQPSRSSRRRRRRCGALALAIAAGTACGSEGDAEPAAPAAATASTPPPDTAPAPTATMVATDVFPVTIEHAYGTTTIPARPERVVSVGYNDQDPIIALGVIPVGVMPWYDDHPLGFAWAEQHYGETPPEPVGGGEFLDINFEKVAALEPDLIVGASGMRQVDYEKAAAIAPTIPQPPGEGDYSSAPWQETQRLVGAALGRSAAAEDVIAAVEHSLDEVRAAHSEFAGRTAVVAQVYEGQYAVRGSAEVWSEFLADLGFTIPDEIVGSDYTEISAERVEMFDDLDLIVWLGTREEVSSPVYDGLAVTRDGRDVYVEALGDLSGAIGFNSALSLPVVIERLVPQLAAAVDGDPATAVPE